MLEQLLSISGIFSAIGPFAVDAGLISRLQDGVASVMIRNTNTGKLIRSSFPVENGEAVAEGAFSIDGVAGSAAKIKLAFLNPAGSQSGKTLPTGNVTDKFDGITATCIDVGNPCVFVPASELNVRGSILADEIEAHPTLLKQLDSIRRQAAVAMMISKSTSEVPGSIPKIAIVSTTHEHILPSGVRMDENSCDLLIRAISVGQPHHACPITVAMALAVASRLKGSTVNACTSKKPVDADGVTLGHNSGKLLVGAHFSNDGSVEDATVFRTARRLMEGKVYWT
jgi:2-methylaconitate cis-trans-isomerase PrpF